MPDKSNRFSITFPLNTKTSISARGNAFENRQVYRIKIFFINNRFRQISWNHIISVQFLFWEFFFEIRYRFCYNLSLLVSFMLLLIYCFWFLFCYGGGGVKSLLDMKRRHNPGISNNLLTKYYEKQQIRKLRNHVLVSSINSPWNVAH